MATASESLIISEEKADVRSSEAVLNSFLQCMFPNHGPAEIIAHRERNDKGEEVIVVKLSIAGEDIRCQGNFESEQAARESLSASAIKFLEAFSNRKSEILPVFQGSRFEDGMRRIFDSAAALKSSHQQPGSPFITMAEEVPSSTSASIIKPLSFISDSNVSPTTKVSCISVLTQYMQKIHPDVKYEPEFVSSNNRFGCKYVYSKKEFLVPAVYASKQEAREALAKQICEQIIPGMLPQSSVSPPPNTIEIPVNSSVDFVSSVNMFCQKGNISPPAYENIQEETMWRVKVVFNDQTFISSSAYPKVQSAKLNVAKQLSEYISEKMAKSETIAKGGLHERPKIPVPGLKSVQASPQIVAPAAAQPIPYWRPPVATVPYPMAYPLSNFYGMMPPAGHESTSMPLSGLHSLAHTNMPNLQPIPGISAQAESSLNMADQTQVPLTNANVQPANAIQSQQMASLYYQQYMAHMHHQMRLMQLQQMMYQQHHSYPHSAPDGSHPSMMHLPSSFPIMHPNNHQPSQDPNNNPYSMPPYPNMQNRQFPPPS